MANSALIAASRLKNQAFETETYLKQNSKGCENMLIRQASVSDAKALLGIYAQYIDTNITFEYALPSETEFAARIAEYGSFYPYLVCEEEGVAIAYAYAHRDRERAAYQWNAELSVYVDKNHCGKGIGKRLYAALLAILKEQGIANVYGCITMPNAASCALHEALGFQKIGERRKTGFKNGCWLNSAWYERRLFDEADEDKTPAHAISIKDIPQERLQAILKSE